MQVTMQAHFREIIHSQGSKEPVTFQWPKGVPLPAIGDEVLWHGANVTIVEREGPSVQAIARGKVDDDDISYTLKWLDLRYFVKPNSLIPPEKSPPQ
jgi:hypothetical protein